MKLFAGTSHPLLAKSIADRLGIQLSEVVIKRFPDGETGVEILEKAVRDQEVYLLQTFSIEPNETLVELLLILDALKRSDAKKITIIVPYLAYSRQDRRNKPGVPITAKLIADILVCAGADRLITFDLHADQIEGFYDIPVEHLHSHSLLLERAEFLKQGTFSALAAPDTGSVKTAESLAKLKKTDLVLIKKTRNGSELSMQLIGDVAGKDLLMSDDVCSTANTLVLAASLCKSKGANRIFAAVNHGLFVGNAIEKIENSPIEKLITTDSIPHSQRVLDSKKIEIVSLSSTIAAALEK